MTTCKNNERIKKEVEIIVKVMKNPVRELAVDSTEPKKKRIQELEHWSIETSQTSIQRGGGRGEA